jgi:hypothetical protein
LRRALALLAWAASAAWAVEAPQWPPPPAVEARMRELRQVIGGRDSTREQRDAARQELGRLMMAPDAKGLPPKAHAPRAAIDPYPSVVAPAPAAPPRLPPMPGVAELEVVTPPKPIVDPRTGAAIAPSAGFAIDPRTGAVLHETPAGYIDPRTGRIVK